MRGNQLSGYSIVIAGVLSIILRSTDETSRVEAGRHGRFLRQRRNKMYRTSRNAHESNLIEDRAHRAFSIRARVYAYVIKRRRAATLSGDMQVSTDPLGRLMTSYYLVDIVPRSGRELFERAGETFALNSTSPPFVYHSDEYLSRGIFNRVSRIARNSDLPLVTCPPFVYIIISYCAARVCTRRRRIRQRSVFASRTCHHYVQYYFRIK